ncbi:MAG: quinoprotein dehydrogenase-associated putative ABC transporter substrate-binding protein [Gemmatimonadales bacterium]|nr:quinoprotein dehydrogenase-associated putative ABC transporter substrate-binding protein [Gemmatimonadales bacterium]
MTTPRTDSRRALRARVAALLACTAALLALPAPAEAQEMAEKLRTSELTRSRSQDALRVCADPDNLPFSNQAGEGFENRIAELIAKAWDRRVEYAWWPVRRGFFTRAMGQGYCDIAITAPSGMDMAATTKPFFRTGYAVVTRADGPDIRALDDERLKTLKIGVHLLNSDAENTPPAMALSAHGVVGNLVGFGTFYSEGGDRPEDIVKAVVDRRIDVAIVWAPLAGYFAKQLGAPVRIVPLPDDAKSGLPFSFDIGMATRRRDRALRDSLQAVIDAQGDAIRSILREFAVPLFPDRAEPARREGTAPAR